MPFFSIIIPTYNRAHVLPFAIESVLQQSFSDYEILVVDDGSTDNTKEKIKDYLSLNNFKYLHKKNAGVCSARNLGSQNAKGSYLIFLDSDDQVENSWLADFYLTITKENALGAYCSIKKIDENGVITFLDANRPFKISSAKGFLIPGSWVIEKSAFMQTGMYDENIKYGENTELRIRLDAMNLPFGIINKFNLIYNISVSGGSQNNLNKLNSILYTINKHEGYFKKNPRLKKVQMQTAAVAAARLGMRRKANQILGELLKEHKSDFRLWVRYCISLNGFLTKWIWK